MIFQLITILSINLIYKFSQVSKLKKNEIMLILFILLLSFSESLARDPTKFLFLNNETCIARPTLINMNPC